jgi:hypothetical protein
MGYDFIQYIVFKNIVRCNTNSQAYKKLRDGLSEILLSLGRSRFRKCRDSKFTESNVLKLSQLTLANHALNYLEGNKKGVSNIFETPLEIIFNFF